MADRVFALWRSQLYLQRQVLLLVLLMRNRTSLSSTQSRHIVVTSCCTSSLPAIDPFTWLQQLSSLGRTFCSFSGSNCLLLGQANLTPGLLIGSTLLQVAACNTTTPHHHKLCHSCNPSGSDSCCVCWLTFVNEGMHTSAVTRTWGWSNWL